MSEVLLHFLCFGFLMSELHSIQYVLELIVRGKSVLFDYSYATQSHIIMA